jgi:hypothetical protein
MLHLLCTFNETLNHFNFAQVSVIRRDNGAKMSIANADLVEEIKKLLGNIQQNMFDVAKQKQLECIQVIHTWDEFVEALDQRKMILAPWCDEKVEVFIFLCNYKLYPYHNSRCFPFLQSKFMKNRHI